LLAEACDGGGIGEVAGVNGGLTAVGDDLVANIVESLGIAGYEQDVGSERGEAEGSGRADAAGGTGDECDLGLEWVHVSIFDAGRVQRVRLLRAIDF
jgi:hypothetical protein